MFVDDLRQDFYNVLLGNRVLLLVHYDVDAICTCKILQGLFQCDNVSYTLVPVGGVSELKTAYEENCEEIKYVVLVNCGGTIDLVDILQPEEDVVFFVLDAHKPTDVCNVYSDGQVRLVYKDNEENIPNFDDIFRDDEDEEEEAEPESGREGLEAAVERRRARREWEERRHTLMFNYTQFSYFGKPSALVILELSWRVSRCGLSVLWAGAVGAAAQRALHTRAPPQCLLDADELHRRVAGLQHTVEDAGAKVVLEKDAWLPLYRAWSLESALRHSPALGPHLKLHTLSGASRVRQLLADMGFPLQQARQSFRSMDVDLRRSLLTALETSAPKHKLPSPTEATFLLQRQHAPPLAALDVVLAILGLIEHETIPKGEGFQLALSALDIAAGNNEARTLGTAAAQKALEATTALVNATLSARMLHLAGPFSYFIIQEGTPESAFVRGAHWLGICARRAATASGASRPLVASASVDHHTCLLIGVPPQHHNEPRKLLEFLPLNRRSEDVLATSFASRGLSELLRLHRAQASQEARRELTQALMDELADEKPVRDLIQELRDMAQKHAIPDHEVVAIIWQCVMSRGEWNKKEELLAEQAAKHLRHYTPLLAAFAQTAKAEIALLTKVQEYCYENMSFMRAFSKLVLMLYKTNVLSEEVILKWYREPNSSKGKMMFLDQMKKFVEWLQSAEEESESGEEED